MLFYKAIINIFYINNFLLFAFLKKAYLQGTFTCGKKVGVLPRIVSRMDRWSGKVAVVTGASIGIGAAITEALVRAGIKVVGVGRRVQRIRELATKLKGQKGILHPMECDVRKEEDIARVFQWTEKELGGVDILVNNAGFLTPEPIIGENEIVTCVRDKKKMNRVIEPPFRIGQLSKKHLRPFFKHFHMSILIFYFINFLSVNL